MRCNIVVSFPTFLLQNYFDHRLSHKILVRLKMSKFEVNSNVFEVSCDRILRFCVYYLIKNGALVDKERSLSFTYSKIKMKIKNVVYRIIFLFFTYFLKFNI